MRRQLTYFEVGDRVWIERTEFVETVEMIRTPQVIENITLVPVTLEDGEPVYIQSIDIKGSGYIYDGSDLKLAEYYE
jgi:hypothetical protein